MKSVNALELRHCLGRVLRLLEADGAPVLVQRGNKPSAVLISLRDFRERFVDRAADEQRRAVVGRIAQLRFVRPKGTTTLGILRQLRSGKA